MSAVSLDPELWTLIPYRLASTEDIRNYIQARQAALAAGMELAFAAIEKHTGRVVGSTRFMNVDLPNKRVEIGGTWIARPWQRTAINTEAKYLMLCHAFETWGCNRVELDGRTQPAIAECDLAHRRKGRRNPAQPHGHLDGPHS